MLQHELDYYDFMGLFSVRLWLAMVHFSNYLTLSMAFMPKKSVVWLACLGMIVDLL